MNNVWLSSPMNAMQQLPMVCERVCDVLPIDRFLAEMSLWISSFQKFEIWMGLRAFVHNSPTTNASAGLNNGGKFGAHMLNIPPLATKFMWFVRNSYFYSLGNLTIHYNDYHITKSTTSMFSRSTSKVVN